MISEFLGPLLDLSFVTLKIYIYQMDGNNIEVPEDAIQQLSPSYSVRNGFMPGM
jgi:hypothetical protein